MKLINMTPHAIRLYTPEGVQAIPASGKLVRVRNRSEHLGDVDCVPVYRDAFDSVEGLPDPQPGVGYIVSSLVLQAVRDTGLSRTDLFAPGTGPADGAIRGPSGQVEGVTRLKVV